MLWSDRGQKHEVWEGGVHVAGWLNGGLVPAHARGTESRGVRDLNKFSCHDNATCDYQIQPDSR